MSESSVGDPVLIEPETNIVVEAESAGRRGGDDVRQRLSRILGFLLPVAFVFRALAVDIAGVVTNDSLGYMRRAAIGPLDEGLVIQGYRQVALPLWVATADRIGQLAGWDRIFGVAVLQRGGLVVGVLLVWWALRAWAIPALLILTSATFVIHADFVLPEGVLMPGCVIAGGLAAGVTTARPEAVRYATAITIASGTLAFLLATIKLQYASLVFLTCGVSWLNYRKRSLISFRVAAAAVAVPLVLVGALAVAQSFENRSELGVFEPVSERARAEWYGSWQALFVADTSNRDDPDLAEFYDEGNLYTFLKGLEGSEPSYPVRAATIRSRIDDMFAAAGTSHLEQQLASFGGALRGGRTDDIAGIVNRALRATPEDQTFRLTLNNVGSQGGIEAVLESVNDNERSGVLATSLVFDRFGNFYEDFRPLKNWVAAAALVILVLSLLVRGEHRPVSFGALVLITSVSAALGSAYIDNARYLLGPFAIILVTATASLRGIYLNSRSRATDRKNHA